jgi:hypothetical protein
VNVASYLGHIPAIEAKIRDLGIDTIVCGMGPTAWLLPWMDQKLVADLHLFGCHDAFRIMAMPDLILMDGPRHDLHVQNFRGAAILASRPKRLWIYEPDYKNWLAVLPPQMHSIAKSVNWGVWKRHNFNPQDPYKTKFKLVDDRPHTTTISPTGATTLAWREGRRRIGILGVDLMKGHHHMFQMWPLIDAFFLRMAQQAEEAGGLIVNLSPVTTLKKFSAWKPSTSGSAPTSGSTQPEPSACSNTASASTPLAPSASTGCAPEIPTGS